MLEKYILIYVNSQQLVQHMFDGERIAKKAETTWLSLDYYVRKESVIEIERQKYELKDSI